MWRHYLDELGEIATVIRYDERGYGLSDWEVDDFGLEARVADLEAVVDDAGLDRFALLAMSQGGPPSILYADRHPERISRLIFYGSYAVAIPDPTPEALEEQDTFDRMIKVGWARPAGTQTRERGRRTASTRRADPGPALAWRSHDGVRAQPNACLGHPIGSPGGAGELEPHRPR